MSSFYVITKELIALYFPFCQNLLYI